MQRLKQSVPYLIIIILIFSVCGCRFDYEETMMAEDLSEEIPETIMKNFSQIMVKESIPTFYIKAEESRSFSKRKETVFFDVHFQEYDKSGDIITDGKADNAKMFNDTESVELWGNLNFYSKREKASLEGEYLFWDNEQSTLSGKPEDTISIVEESGTTISGKGFYAESRTKLIKFNDQVSGSWIDE